MSKISGGGSNPSPENPVEIETVSIGKIASFGKNFAKGVLDAQCAMHECTVSETDNVFTIAATGSDAFFGEVRSVGQSRSGSEGKLFLAIPGKKIYFKSMNGVFDKSYIQQWDKDLNSLGFLDGNSVNGKDLAAGTKYISLRIGIAGSAVGSTYTDKIMLSFDPITEWEEPYYEEQVVSLDLYSLPDGTCDEVIDDKLIRRIKKLDLDGSSDEIFNTQNPNSPYISYADRNNIYDPWTKSANAGPILCNRLKSIAPDVLWLGSVQGISIESASASRIRFRINGITTIDAFRTWLQSNPLIIYAKLAKPQATPITDLIIPTQAPYTIVSHDSPVETEVEYEILTKSDYAADIIDIKQRLAALESAALE